MNLVDLARAALAEQSSAPATPSQAAELRELVALIFGDTDDIGPAEVLRAALVDPLAALMSLRALGHLA